MGQIARNDRLSLMAVAEGYARVGLAVADAFIGCWQTKCTYNVLRPVTYIQDILDADWLPLLVTRPFPEYPSGHSTQSGAVATVLTDLFGVKAFTDTTHSDHDLTPPQMPRTFRSFDEAAEEAALSRLYGGIHYAPGNTNGLPRAGALARLFSTGLRSSVRERSRGVLYRSCYSSNVLHKQPLYSTLIAVHGDQDAAARVGNAFAA
jgi:hypothetical protein